MASVSSFLAPTPPGEKSISSGFEAISIPQFVGEDYNNYTTNTSHASEDVFNDEAPLLEELGIDLITLRRKLFFAVFPFRATPKDIASHSEMTFPLAAVLLIGLLMLFSSKFMFKELITYTFAACIAIRGMLALLISPFTLPPDTARPTTEVYTVMSSVGYGFLPIVFLAAASVFVPLKTVPGFCVCLLALVWATTISTQLLCKAMSTGHQRLIVAYPLALLHAVFVLMVV